MNKPSHPAVDWSKKKHIKNTIHVWVICPNCNAGRWRIRRQICQDILNKKFTGQCFRCYVSNQNQNVKVYCAYCSKVKYVKPSKTKSVSRHFCNHECKARWQSLYLVGKKAPGWRGGKISVDCDHCGKSLKIQPVHFKKHQHHFCNRICVAIWQSSHWRGENHPSWKGGYNSYYNQYRGPNWQKQRAAAHKRDNYRCQICNISEQELGKELDVHHVISLKKFNSDYKSANQLTNLICLCPHCHRLAEHDKVSIQPKLL